MGIEKVWPGLHEDKWVLIYWPSITTIASIPLSSNDTLSIASIEANENFQEIVELDGVLKQDNEPPAAWFVVESTPKLNVRNSILLIVTVEHKNA